MEHAEFGKLQICSCRQSQVTQQVRQRLFELSQLIELSHLTFDNFDPQGRGFLWPEQATSLEVAYNTARHFAQALNGWLLLLGEYGCGKTHLAAAIANFAVDLGVPTLFITVPDLLDTLRFAYQDPQATFEGRFNEIRQAPLLVMDDFGTQNATSWAQEKLFQIVNYRYINRLPMVVTTNLSFEAIEERIQSRLEDPELVTTIRILAPDYRNPAGDTGHHKLSSLELHQDCKFAHFELRKNEGLSAAELLSLEKAFDAAREYAEDPQGWLVFIGGHSTGKTHLAAAIGLFYADTREPPQFHDVAELLDHLRDTFNPAITITLNRRFEDVRTTQLLILDDLRTQSATPWAREKLRQLFNYRYVAKLPTVITSSISMEDIDDQLRSRMLDKRLCNIYHINVPPYRGDKPSKSKSESRRKRSK